MTGGPRVVVLTPWRDDGPDGHRTALYAAVKPDVAALGFEVIEGDSGHQPFSLGNTYNHLAERAGRWDAIVLHEADYWVPPGQIHEAVHMVLAGFRGQVYAYDLHCKLSEAATRRHVEGYRGEVPRHEYNRGRNRIGGPRVIGRDLWEAIGGYPSEFVGWGYEDNALRDLAWQVHPHHRVAGPLYNLWHPKHVGDDPYWREREANRQRYLDVRARIAADQQP